MSDMWRSREPPVPLDFDAIMDGTFVLRPDDSAAEIGTTNGHGVNGVDKNASASGSKSAPNAQNGHSGSKTAPAPTTAAGTTVMKDQKELSLKDNVELFVSRYV